MSKQSPKPTKKNTKKPVKSKAKKISLPKEKAKKVIQKMGENGGNTYKAMIEVGYSPSYAKGGKIQNTTSFRDAYKENVDQDEVQFYLRRNMRALRPQVKRVPATMSIQSITEMLDAIHGHLHSVEPINENESAVLYYEPDYQASNGALKLITTVGEKVAELDKTDSRSKFAKMKPRELQDFINKKTAYYKKKKLKK